MPFTPRFARAAALALAFSAAAAHADVTYTLSFSGAQFYGAQGGVPVTYGGGFTVTTAEPVTSAQWLVPSACSLTGAAITAYLACSGMHVLDAEGYGVGGVPGTATGHAFIGFATDNLAFPGAGFIDLLWFAPGALSTNGVHNLSVGPLDPVGSPYGNSVLSATLTVAGVVPEPGSAVLMALGAAGLLAARRRRG